MSPEAEVKGNKKVLGTVTYPEYASIDAALAEMSEAKILEFLNVQIKTSTMNEFRRGHTTSNTVSKAALQTFVNECDDLSLIKAVTAAMGEKDEARAAAIIRTGDANAAAPEVTDEDEGGDSEIEE